MDEEHPPKSEWVHEWLHGLRGAERIVSESELDELREQLDETARAAIAEVPVDRLPLRAPKARVASVLRCERRTVASLGLQGPLTEAVAMGRLVDRLVVLSTRGALSLPAGAAVRGHLVADPDPELTEVAERHALLDALDAPAKVIDAAFGTACAPWWPRSQVPVTLDLAEGRVLVSARLDLELGGPGTDLPGAIVEVKSGNGHDDHRHDLYLYGLLAALRRDTAPPVGLATWYLDGGLAAQRLDAGVLRAAARRLGDAITALGALAAGATPTERPGSCRWCPVEETCPSAAGAPTSTDEWGDDTEDDDDGY